MAASGFISLSSFAQAPGIERTLLALLDQAGPLLSDHGQSMEAMLHQKALPGFAASDCVPSFSGSFCGFNCLQSLDSGLGRIWPMMTCCHGLRQAIGET
jgi:environmental stress-induced protein Ves